MKLRIPAVRAVRATFDELAFELRDGQTIDLSRRPLARRAWRYAVPVLRLAGGDGVVELRVVPTGLLMVADLVLSRRRRRRAGGAPR